MGVVHARSLTKTSPSAYLISAKSYVFNSKSPRKLTAAKTAANKSTAHSPARSRPERSSTGPWHRAAWAAGGHRVAVVAAQLVLHHLAIGQAPVAEQLVQRDPQRKQVAARVGQLAGGVAAIFIARPLLRVHVAGGSGVQAACGLGLAA